MRFLQYSDYLATRHIYLDVLPLLDDHYLEELYAGRRPWGAIIKAYWRRLLALMKAREYDLIWLEKEAFPRLPSWFEQLLLPTGIPLAVDYDDAVFHQYDQHPSSLFRLLMGDKIDRVMQRADLVVAGNSYIAEHASAVGAGQVEILPTVVDTTRYQVVPPSDGISPVTVGWIGTPSTASFLQLVSPALEKFSGNGVRFLAVGANPPQVEGTPFVAVPWTENGEVAMLQDFDIGIMPLPDAPFERGKCGYKLIQYMACGKPVIASPVGANNEIVRHGTDGFLAETLDQWQLFLLQLIDSKVLRLKMGEAGRRRVEEKYSLEVAAPRLVDLLKLACANRVNA